MTDRVTLLRDAAPEELARLFVAVPTVGAVVARPPGQRVPVGGWPGSLRAVTAPRDLDGLARVLADPAIVVATLMELSQAQFQLVQLAGLHGGVLRHAQVVEEAGEEMAGELDADADVLARLFLAHRRSAWLTLFPGVSDVIETEGVRLEDGLEATNSDVLGVVLRTLGHRSPPTRKAERIEVLVRHLRDPAALRATVADLSAEARAVLHRLVEDHPQRAYTIDPAYRRRYWGGGRPSAVSPLQVLEDHGLVHISAYGELVEVWTEVVVTLRGRLFDTWARPPVLRPAALDPVVPAVPPVVGTLDRLLGLWASTPAAGLASGGIGVRAVKAAAKALGETPATVATVAALAVELGLLGVVTTAPATRQGNRWTTEKTGWAPTSLRTQWDELDPVLRWAHLVQAWRSARLLDESDGAPDRAVAPEHGLDVVLGARRRILAVLAELPPGTGVEATTLARHLALRHPFEVHVDGVPGLVAVLRVLGLVPAQGLVGLTDVGRRVLAEPSAAAEAIGPGERTFIVQPDLTIVAPPDLEPAVLARLDDYANCESTAGARLYRIDEGRLARALDAGATAASVLAFLADHSTVELPATVRRLVHDVAGRHGSLRAGAATSYLVSEDPALLSRAVSVRAARLRALAPTVAVSPLTRGKLVAVLRDKGLVPVAEGSDGGAIELQEQRGQPLSPTDGLPPLRTRAEEQGRLAKRARALARA